MVAILNPIARYAHWLHTRWPAGGVEKLPEVGPDGATSVPGVRIVGDLTGIPLLKFSADTGARAVQAIVEELRAEERKTGRMEEWKNETTQPSNLPSFQSSALDLAIVGAGVSGISAALEAKKAGLSFQVFEATQPFSTIANFPKAKPIYLYPTTMAPAGQLKLEANVKEALFDELESQRKAAGIEPSMVRIERIERKRSELWLHLGTDQEPVRARRVILAIGRTGNYRKLNIPGEHLDKVYNRLYDPRDFAGKQALVVGGGDSALETAIALGIGGAHVTLSYRNKEFSRPKPENVEKIRMLEKNPSAPLAVERPTSDRVTTAISSAMMPERAAGSLRLMMASHVREIRPDSVVVRDAEEKDVELRNDVVFVMIGREAPLGFFRRSGIAIRGEWTARTWIGFLLFFAFCVLLFHFKSDHPQEFALQERIRNHGGFPYNVPALFDRLGDAARREGNFLYTLKDSMAKPPFYYTFAYCACVVGFGIRRIRRRKTPYVTWQTLVLMCIQCIPLFLLPEIILPWLGRNGFFSHGGSMQWLADHLFERYDAIGHERAWWRSYGLILAFPLSVYNVFTPHPMWLWLGICFVQTFVLIPLLIWRWGKGAYCGWICSCGALAETLGDAYRYKMPHGPLWNRLNMVGQAILAFAVVILGLRIAGWVLGPGSWAGRAYQASFENIPFLNYSWSVDILMAGIIGVGMYFWFSGRVWCRFACPLAALMHIYARFSRFRIFPEKSRCISCNVCTAACHQGIDIMNFANKGLPMQDPECVRCSACVQECPTGVLAFGRFGSGGKIVLDKTHASPVRMREGPAKH